MSQSAVVPIEDPGDNQPGLDRKMPSGTWLVCSACDLRHSVRQDGRCPRCGGPSGARNVTPVAVQLSSASAFAALNGPWMVSVSIPVGAVVFLIYRRARFAPPAGS